MINPCLSDRTASRDFADVFAWFVSRSLLCNTLPGAFGLGASRFHFLLLLLMLLSGRDHVFGQPDPDGFVFVQGGVFRHQVGAGESGPTLRVEDFEILDHPVTNAEYRVFVDAAGHPHPLHWTGGRIPAGKDEYPVIFVNRADARAYLDWISQRDGRVYRLPLSAEYEYAARGGRTRQAYPWGDAAPDEQANYDATGDRRYDRWQDHLRPARWSEPNDFGLYGMAGNVWEMVTLDREHSLSNFAFRVTQPWEREPGLMGGSWARGAEYLKIGYILRLSSGNRHPDLGFRPVRSPAGDDWRVQSRRLAAAPLGDGKVLLGWALRADDDPEAGFHVYRAGGGMRNHAGFRVTDEPVRATTTFIDDEVTAGQRYQYYVRTVDGSGREGRRSEWAGVRAEAEASAVVASFRPIAREGSRLVPVFGDFNGDGSRDVVIRIDNGIRERSRSPEAGVQDPGGAVQIEAFTADGRPLWRKDLGDHEHSYGNANNLPVVVWDMDGDGRDEVVARVQIGDSMSVAVIDGMTGRVLRTAPWPDMATDFAKSSTRVHMSIAYLDGKNPAIVTQTGLYENEIFAAYDAQLDPLWRFESFAETSGSGSHRIEVADVDGDGRQEVFDGTTVLNSDGTLRWSIYRQHPDLVAIRDFLPDRPGLEVCFLVESSIHAGIYMVDASTGDVIWKINREDDPRWTHAHVGWTADIWSGTPGIEAISNRDGHGDRRMVLFDAAGNMLLEPFPYGCHPLERDGDGTRELIHQSTFSIGDFDGTRVVPASAEAQPEIPARADLLMTADLYGDFRDELVLMVANEQGHARIDVLTAVHAATHRYISPAETLDYRLWLARNMGGGYRSVFDQRLKSPGE
ncbi:MAG: SUMF1/EgtB/PvdO family nonheme iron enzyme [Opitutaceae bacterium]